MLKETRDKLKLNPDKYRKIQDVQNIWYKEYYQKPDVKKKILQLSKNYYAKHFFYKLVKEANRSVKRLSNPILLKSFDIWKIAKHQKCKCALTGITLTKENCSLDHIVPVSKGGNNNPENLRLVLKSVNIAKNVLSDTEFIEMCKQVISYKT